MPPIEIHSVDSLSLSTPALQAQYGFCQGRAAYARETSPGCWQVKVHEPQHRDVGLDGWRTVTAGSPALIAASAATGFSPA